MYNAFHSGFRRLPPSWRTGLKRFLGADGHGESALDWLTARKDATGKKRLDNALEGLMNTIGPEATSLLNGKTCIDFGAGYVPTDGVAMWLMGASVVHGVDYNNIARPREVARAVTSADDERLEKVLRTYRAGPEWSGRLEILRQWARGAGGTFPPGYSYLAPVDVLVCPSQLPKFDVLVSTSVLEHIPPSQIETMLTAIKSRENDHAYQFHRVDLRDHRDFAHNPYGFLDQDCSFDPEAEADSRGNGMTLNDWLDLLSGHPEWDLVVGEYQPGTPHLLPRGTRTGLVVADWLVVRTTPMAS